ncbi:hypothetical protein AAFF_G00339070, partial [Aldrovandia affinis]
MEFRQHGLVEWRRGGRGRLCRLSDICVFCIFCCISAFVKD